MHASQRHFRRDTIALALITLLQLALPTSASGGCPSDLDGDSQVSSSDLLVLLAAWGPCRGCTADLDGDGNVALSDLLNLLSNWGPCVDACDFEDVRTEVENAADDPPHVQRNYDAINRTSQLFRDIPFEQWFNASLIEIRPLVQVRLESMEACTGLVTDVPSISGLLDELELVAAGVPIRAIITAIPGEFEDIKGMLDKLRLYGFGFPPSATDPDDSLAKDQAIEELIASIPSLTYRDFYWADPETITDSGHAAFALVKTTRVLKYTAIDPDTGDVFGICDNDRCCHKYKDSGVEINECNKEEDSFCKKRIDGNLCRVGADDCADG